MRIGVGRYQDNAQALTRTIPFGGTDALEQVLGGETRQRQILIGRYYIVERCRWYVGHRNGGNRSLRVLVEEQHRIEAGMHFVAFGDAGTLGHIQLDESVGCGEDWSKASDDKCNDMRAL